MPQQQLLQVEQAAASAEGAAGEPSTNFAAPDSLPPQQEGASSSTGAEEQQQKISEQPTWSCPVPQLFGASDLQFNMSDSCTPSLLKLAAAESPQPNQTRTWLNAAVLSSSPGFSVSSTVTQQTVQLLRPSKSQFKRDIFKEPGSCSASDSQEQQAGRSSGSSSSQLTTLQGSSSAHVGSAAADGSTGAADYSATQLPCQSAMTLTRLLSKLLAPVTADTLFSPFPATFTPSAESDSMSQWVPMQRVLLVHPDLEDNRLLTLAQQSSSSSGARPHMYTPIPAMLFGGAPCRANGAPWANGCLALLLADVAAGEDRATVTMQQQQQQQQQQQPEHQPRLLALAGLRRRLLALEREPLCGAVMPQFVAEENAIANEYRQLFVQPTTAAAAEPAQLQTPVTVAHVVFLCVLRLIEFHFVSAQEFLEVSPPPAATEFADVEEAMSLLHSMLQGTKELELSNCASLWFFGLFHQAHIHLYELDVPIDVDKAFHHSNGSVASAHALQDLQTSAGGLYVAFNSPTGMLKSDSIINHESEQSEHPRILLASLVSRRGQQRSCARYAPLIPLPTTLPASDLHPWNTSMHSTKIPLALVASNADLQQSIDALIYLQPRYSQYAHCFSFAVKTTRHSIAKLTNGFDVCVCVCVCVCCLSWLDWSWQSSAEKVDGSCPCRSTLCATRRQQHQAPPGALEHFHHRR